MALMAEAQQRVRTTSGEAAGKRQMSPVRFDTRMTEKPLRRRIGEAVRTCRTGQGLSLRGLSARCGVSKTHIADVEAGRYAGSPDVLDEIAAALDATIVFGLRGASIAVGGAPRGAGAGDAAAAVCLDVMRRVLVRHEFETANEIHVQSGPVHGWVVLLAFDRSMRRLIILEIKTELKDLGGLDRQIDVYVRGCLEAAHARWWHPVEVLVVVVVLATRENDAIIAANRHLLAASFPARGRALVAGILDHAAVEGRGRLVIDPRRTGRQVLTSCRVDGRRTDAPHRDYADFMRSVRDGANNTQSTRPAGSRRVR
jgi:transcriptional regulator with XRE-family HTH domain